VELSQPGAGPILDHHPAITDAEFTFNGRQFAAKGRVTDDGFLVMKGSRATAEEATMFAGYRQLRARLLENGTLQGADGQLVFTRDYLFNSPSAAASVVAGGSRSGLKNWTVGEKTLGELEESAVDQSASEREETPSEEGSSSLAEKMAES